jgi:hypothetical protein
MEQVIGQQTDGNQADNEQVDKEQVIGQQTDGNQADNEQTVPQAPETVPQAPETVPQAPEDNPILAKLDLAERALVTRLKTNALKRNENDNRADPDQLNDELAVESVPCTPTSGCRKRAKRRGAGQHHGATNCTLPVLGAAFSVSAPIWG